MTKRTIAALQLGSDQNGTAKTLERVLTFEQDIKQSDCDLLVMPEALLGGYPKGANFGTRLGYRTSSGRKDFLQYWQQAIDLDGPEVAGYRGRGASALLALCGRSAPFWLRPHMGGNTWP